MTKENLIFKSSFWCNPGMAPKRSGRPAYAGARVRTAISVARGLYNAGKTIGRFKTGPGLRGAGKRKTAAQPRTQQVQRVRPAAVGSTFSTYVKRFKPQRGLGFIHKLAVPRIYTKMDGNTTKLAQNKQQYTSYRTLNDVEMTSLYAMVTSGLDGSTASTAADVRIFLETAQMEYLLTNGANTNLFVDIFELTCRRDQALGASASGTANNVYLSDPTGMVDQGIYELNSALTMNSLGFGPFQSRMFTTGWKCDKWITIELQPGKTHKHLSVTHVNRYIEKDRTSQAQNYGGLTRSVMIRVRGQPVCDSTTDTNVALSEGELQIVAIRKVIMKVASNPTGIATTTNNLSTVTTSLMNEESGTKQTYTHA